LVGTAALELAPLPLYRQIQEFGNRAYAVGCSELHILPLFLLQGVHVTDDIPAELDQARQMLNPGLRIHLHPSLGSHPQMTDYVQASFHQDLTRPSSARLLVAHGSRRAGGNASIEAGIVP
jgi:sirohydrochlorin cobaltochelatase